MKTWAESRRHPLDICQQLPPVEAHERLFYEAPEVTLPYRGLIWFALIVACGAVWFGATVLVISYVVKG